MPSSRARSPTGTSLSSSRTARNRPSRVKRKYGHPGRASQGHGVYRGRKIIAPSFGREESVVFIFGGLIFPCPAPHGRLTRVDDSEQHVKYSIQRGRPPRRFPNVVMGTVDLPPVRSASGN